MISQRLFLKDNIARYSPPPPPPQKKAGTEDFFRNDVMIGDFFLGLFGKIYRSHGHFLTGNRKKRPRAYCDFQPSPNFKEKLVVRAL